MGLGILILGLLVFLGTHVFVSFREARARAIAQLGLPAYRGLFALVSLVGLALIVYALTKLRLEAANVLLIKGRDDVLDRDRILAK